MEQRLGIAMRRARSRPSSSEDRPRTGNCSATETTRSPDAVLRYDVDELPGCPLIKTLSEEVLPTQ
jgi:hypothetical protein